MQVRRLSVGDLGANCWIVSRHETDPVLVIDPGGDAPTILSVIGDAPVSAVVLTHAHFDHVGAAGEVCAASGAPLLAHTEDASRVTHDSPEGTGGSLFGYDGMVAPHPDRLLEDGDIVEAGRLRARVLHTPGHTQGGICVLVDDPDGGPAHLFSGDTLFAGSVGRTDFPGGDARSLSRSIASKLSSLPAETIVHPGHGPDTTIAREARLNPFWPRT